MDARPLAGVPSVFPRFGAVLDNALTCLTTQAGGSRGGRTRPEAGTIDDLRALLPARAGDEFQTSEPSEEVPNPIDEHPEEEQ